MCLRKAAARRSSTTHWTPVLGPVLLRLLSDNDMQISNYPMSEAQTGSTLRSVLNRRKGLGRYNCLQGQDSYTQVARSSSRGATTAFCTVRFSHQDSPSADVWKMHHCRSRPCVSEVPSAACREP